VSGHLTDWVLEGVGGHLVAGVGRVGRVVGLSVGRVVSWTQALEEKEVGVARRCIERIRHVDDHVGGPELHPGILAVGKPRRPASRDELLTAVNHPRPLVGPQG
jgi:hypothetical protein